MACQGRGVAVAGGHECSDPVLSRPREEVCGKVRQRGVMSREEKRRGKGERHAPSLSCPPLPMPGVCRQGGKGKYKCVQGGRQGGRGNVITWG